MGWVRSGRCVVIGYWKKHRIFICLGNILCHLASHKCNMPLGHDCCEQTVEANS